MCETGKGKRKTKNVEQKTGNGDRDQETDHKGENENGEQEIKKKILGEWGSKNVDTQEFDTEKGKSEIRVFFDRLSKAC